MWKLLAELFITGAVGTVLMRKVQDQSHTLGKEASDVPTLSRMSWVEKEKTNGKSRKENRGVSDS